MEERNSRVPKPFLSAIIALSIVLEALTTCSAPASMREAAETAAPGAIAATSENAL